VLTFIADTTYILLHSELAVNVHAIKGEEHRLSDVWVHQEKHNNESTDKFSSEFLDSLLLNLTHYAPESEAD